MGLLQRFFGRKPAQFHEDQSETEKGPTWDTPCTLSYGDFANPLLDCKRCGHLIGRHARCEPKPGSVTYVDRPDGDTAEEPPLPEDIRAPHNARGQVILAREQRQSTATELIAAAGNSVPALAAALTTIASRFEDSVRASDAMNRGLGEFRAEVIVPLREELKFLRYNLGDKVNRTTTNMEVMVDQLDKTIWGALRASGLTDAQIRTYREEHGMQPEAPSGQELELHMTQHQGLMDQVAALTEQNRRLLELLGGEPEHVFWAEDAGQWVFHEGCVCERCRSQSRGNEMTREASGQARRDEPPPPPKPRRSRRK